jgi:outer membrane lipoprotein SlyB
MNRLAIIATLAALSLSACQKKDQAATTDSTARDLTLAPTESTTTMRDVPANPPPATHTPPPSTRPPAARPPAPPPARAATRTLSAGSKLDMAANDTISSRTAKVGESFTAHVVDDVMNAAGQVVIPKGSVLNGTITGVKPAPNPKTPGTLTLAVNSVTVGGHTYPIEAAVDSIETIHKGRGVTTGDAAKVGAGAAAGAILGRVIGGNSKGTIIGGIVGAAAGAGVASTTKDSDIVLPAGAHIIVRLTKELTVSGS